MLPISKCNPGYAVVIANINAPQAFLVQDF